MTLAVRTPFGHPVAWADVSLSSLRWESGDTRNDPCCLVVSGRRLGQARPKPLDDFLLCMVADGVSGGALSPSTSEQPVRRASQSAQAACIEAFLASEEVDVLWRLRDAVRAADARLAAAAEGRPASTLTAVFVAGDGSAYGVSVGDSPLLVVPPRQEIRRDTAMKKLGHERITALGTGETLQPGSGAGGEDIIEQWWPDLEGDGTRTRLEPGTSLMLLGNRRQPDGSTSETDRDNGSVITVRFDGRQVSTSQLVAHAGWLVSVVGYLPGVSPGAKEVFGLACLAAEGAHGIVAGMLRAVLELDPREATLWSREELERSYVAAGGDLQRTPLAVVASGLHGTSATFASGGASVGRDDLAEQTEGRLFTLRLGSDPLDRGIPIEFQHGVAPASRGQALVDKRGPRQWRWTPSLARLWRMWRRQ